MSETDWEALERAYDRALRLEKAGRLDQAATAWRAVLALDPHDCGGAAIRLASLGRGPTPERASPAYVTTLFDQHADVFDMILVDQLGYDVPALTRAMLDQHAPGPYRRLLDLGCGSGLAGEALGDIAGHLTGVDLSPAMIEIAGERAVYDRLYVGEVVRFLAEHDAEPWDLIVATDVLPYLGSLEPLFAMVSRRLTADGVFAFSTETLPEAGFAGAGYVVGPHQRFAHRDAYVVEALAGAGLACRRLEPIDVRHETGAPVPGHLVIADKPA